MYFFPVVRLLLQRGQCVAESAPMKMIFPQCGQRHSRTMMKTIVPNSRIVAIVKNSFSDTKLCGVKRLPTQEIAAAIITVRRRSLAVS